MLVALMGRFKGEDGDKMHLLPLLNCRSTGISPVAIVPVNIICSRSVLRTGQD